MSEATEREKGISIEMLSAAAGVVLGFFYLMSFSLQLGYTSYFGFERIDLSVEGALWNGRFVLYPAAMCITMVVVMLLVGRTFPPVLYALAVVAPLLFPASVTAFNDHDLISGFRNAHVAFVGAFYYLFLGFALVISVFDRAADRKIMVAVGLMLIAGLWNLCANALGRHLAAEQTEFFTCGRPDHLLVADFGDAFTCVAVDSEAGTVTGIVTYKMGDQLSSMEMKKVRLDAPLTVPRPGGAEPASDNFSEKD